ncbi:5,6-dimethylbenzimidazole synthase [Fluviibacterium sp. DFM31]|uniref:5,6-dimethylbenzimidazole synthase n=1 Tax=Meridianimarinicoccus marinus TaxID=3231483 RepID=A0ABV3L3U1_9RHOB
MGVQFSDSFRHDLAELMRWRRDVRRFRSDPVDGCVLDRCLQSFTLAPSVGLSQPWRLRRIASGPARDSARRNFTAANAAALGGYDGDKAATYAGLKLSGMDMAPEQIAVFCDEATAQGAGLGAGTMPEMRRYSVVCAIMQFWLAARAEGLGVGWVSILDAPALCRDWNMPETWELVAYLCIGWPEDDGTDPELEKAGWETRRSLPPLETL